MSTTCVDAAFGVMEYKHRWVKSEQIALFGKEWEIKVVAKAYSGKPITDEERTSYLWFCEYRNRQIELLEEKLCEYVNAHCEDFASVWRGARKVTRAIELQDIVIPKTLLFQQDGAVLFLFECPWDPENGCAVMLRPEVRIGSQDLFL